MTMLNRDFVKWVAIAFIMATPIAYYAMNKWLEGFAYHVDLDPWIFLQASATALFLAMATVLGHALTIAKARPARALRYE